MSEWGQVGPIAKSIGIKLPVNGRGLAERHTIVVALLTKYG